MAKKEVQFDVVAKDEASKVVDKIADKAEQLEKSDPTVTVDAETGDARHTLDGLDDQLDKLTDADKIVVLALRAGAAKTELADLAGDLARIDAADPDVAVKFDRYAEVSGQLDHLETQMKQIAATSPDPDVNDTVRNRLKGIGEEAGKTQGAVHSMAGNALGDFAATTSGIGPLGEAIGQLTETALEGEGGLKSLATAGLGLGALSAGMLLVNLAMQSFADAAAKAAKIKAFRDDEVDAFVASMKKGADVTADMVARLTEVGEVVALVTKQVGNWQLTNLEDISPLLAEAGITARQFAEGVTGTSEDLDRFNAAVKATSLSVDQQQEVITGAARKFEDLRTAEENHDRFAAVFGNTAKQIELLSASTQEMRNKLVGADKAADGLAGSLGSAVKETDRLTGAYQHLSDEISGDQAMIDLADQIAAVTDAGDAAIKSQQEANAAIKQNAEDATAKQREAEAAMRDYQSQVNSTKQSIIDIAATAHASPVELEAALKKLDAGDLAGAKADAEAWSKRNPIQLTGSIGTILGTGLGKSQSSQQSTTTMITQFLAVPDARRQAAALQRTARVNGRR